MNLAFANLTGSYRTVLDAILRRGPSSRAELAEETGYTRPAITQMVQELTSMGLVTELPARKGVRGQPARPLTMRASAGFSVGVNFSHSYLELGVLDLGGLLVGELQTPLSAPTVAVIGAAIRDGIETLMASKGLVRERLIGVGISVPGDFDRDGNVLAHSFFPDLAGPGLQQRLEALIGCPCVLENDGRASAIGERVVGIGAKYATLMLVHIGHGVGGGLIIDGKPYRGALGNAGILGQFYPYGQPRPSGQDLLETLGKAGFKADDFNDLESLPRTANALVDTWIERAARQLEGDIARVARFLGPDAIVLAGRLPPAIIERLVQAIDLDAGLPPYDKYPNPPLKASSLGSSAGMIGGAAVPILRCLLPTD